MSELKEMRLKALSDVLTHLNSLREMYQPASPGWVLINAAWVHVKSTHYLQRETCLLDHELQSLEKAMETFDDTNRI